MRIQSLFLLAKGASAGVSNGPDGPWNADDCAEFATSVGGFGTLNASYVEAQSLNTGGIRNVASLCRLFAQAPYDGNKSSVFFEVWLPDPTTYNNRLLVVGNGGLAGTIDEAALLNGVNNGYAVAGGNAGHLASQNNDGTGAPGVLLPFLHDRAQLKAWIHDSIAFFTPAAKRLAEVFYGETPGYSYYQGCSTGGAQGFALAQFHPELFDGIIAGCPGNWYSHLALSFLWNAQVTAGTGFLPDAALKLITDAVVAKCDQLDGVEDGVLEDPLLCEFDMTSLECTPAQTSSSACLTSEQVEAVRKIYTGPVDTRTNASIYPGFSVGSEVEWLAQQGPLANSFSIPILQNTVFDKLSYDAVAFNWGSDVDLVDEKIGRFIDEIGPDLSSFQATGAKMIVYQGWADAFNAATWPIEHLHRIEAFFGGDVGDWFKLFMIPGGGHCASAFGERYQQVPATWHALEALVQWVETGRPPTEILGTDPADNSKSEKTSKLCPWPQTARYLGGDPDDWESYVCSD